jgi:hypothetical protein
VTQTGEFFFLRLFRQQKAVSLKEAGFLLVIVYVGKNCVRKRLAVIYYPLSPTKMTFGCRKQTAISKKEIADCSVINKVIFWHNKKVSDFPRFIFRIALLQSSFRLQFVITPCIFWCIIFLRMRSLESSTLHYGIISCTELCATQQNVCVAQWRLFLNQWNFPPRSEKLLLNSGCYPGLSARTQQTLQYAPKKFRCQLRRGEGMNAIK